MQFARCNGQTIHFSDRPALSGNSTQPAIVLINSLGTDFRIWDDVAALLPGHRIIRYDKRGHGLSDCPPAPYSIEDHAGDLEALLEDLGIGDVVLVGLSVGGLISLALSARRPEWVRAIVMMDTAHKIGTAEMWATRIEAIENGGIASISDAILERWFSPDYRADEPESFAAYSNMLIRSPQEGYLGTCMAIRDADYTDVAKALSVPVLCMVGSNDGSTPPDLVRSCHELVANSRFEIVDGPGHLPCIEKPQETADLIKKFLKQNNLG